MRKKSRRICAIDRIILNVRILINPTLKPNRVLGHKSSCLWIIIPCTVIVKVGVVIKFSAGVGVRLLDPERRGFDIAEGIVIVLLDLVSCLVG